MEPTELALEHVLLSRVLLPAPFSHESKSAAGCRALVLVARQGNCPSVLTAFLLRNWTQDSLQNVKYEQVSTFPLARSVSI